MKCGEYSTGKHITNNSERVEYDSQIQLPQNYGNIHFYRFSSKFHTVLL